MDAVRFNNEGTHLFKCGNYEAAVTKFTEGMRLTGEPEQLGLLYSNRSSAYLNLRRLQEAISDAKSCVKYRPQLSKSFLRLGKALEENGEYAASCEVYYNAINDNPAFKQDFLQPLIDVNNRCMHFSCDFMDLLEMSGEKYCKICRKKENVLCCSHCKSIFYCGKEHQKEDWAVHKGQCKLIVSIDKDLSEISHLPQNLAPFIFVEKVFLSLDIKCWDTVWKHLRCMIENESFKKIVSEALSWPMTLISSLDVFDLRVKGKLRIHILGATSEYIGKGLFTSLLQFFPLPDAEIILIGPELPPELKPIQYINSSGKSISLSFVPDLYHNFTKQDMFSLPDLVLAYHSGIHEPTFDWKPTLYYIVKNAIPSVFTMWNEEEFIDSRYMLQMDVLKTNILREGKAPFPSLLSRYLFDRWKFVIRTMNSYWICFQGGNPMLSEDVDAQLGILLKELGFSDNELKKMKSNPDKAMDDPMIKRKGYDVTFAFLYEKVSTFLSSAESKYNEGDYFAARNDLNSAIRFTKHINNCPDDDAAHALQEKMNELASSAYLMLSNISEKIGK